MRWRRVARRVAVVLAACVAVPTVLLYLAQERFVYQPSPDVPPVSAALPGADEVRYSTSDGLELRGWFLPAAPDPTAPGPPGASAAGAGHTVVWFHGSGGNRASGAEVARRLAAEGFSVFLPEYRGFGESPGSPSEAGLQIDGEAAIDAVSSLPGVDPGRLVFVGESLGSGIAVGLAVRRRPVALVLLTPYTSLPDVAWSRLPGLPYRALMRDTFDSLGTIGDVAVPVLVIGSNIDRVVPPSHSIAIHDAADAPKHLVMLDGVGHLVAAEAGPRVVEEISAFLADHPSP